MTSRLPKHLFDALAAARANAIVLDTVAKDLPPLMAALEAELLAYPQPSAPA